MGKDVCCHKVGKVIWGEQKLERLQKFMRGTRELLLREQARARDLCGTRSKPGTSMLAGPNQGHLWEQA